MQLRKRLILIPIMLILASLSCEFLPGGGSGPEAEPADAIATSVAATIAAGSGESGSDPQATEELTQAPSATPEPVPLAPPGLVVVYTKDGDLYQWTPGSLPALLAAVSDAHNVRVSADGSVAAFTRGPDYYYQTLWAINLDGSGLRQLVNSTTLDTYKTHPEALSARLYRFEFIPGTHQVAFTTQLTFEGPGLILNADLRVVGADTSVLTTVLPPGSGGDFYYSLDGSQVGISTPTGISVVNADGANRRDLLSFPAVITYSEYQYSPPLTWTPDGAALRVAVPAEDPLASSPGPTRVWHLPVDGSAPMDLLSLLPVPFFQHAPELSGDASRVAYLVEISPGSPPLVELHVSNADGTGDMIYATGPLAFQDWAEDGVHFLYTDGTSNPKIGEYGTAPAALSGLGQVINAEWVHSTRFLLRDKSGADFRFWAGEVGSPILLLDSSPNISSFSFGHNY